MAKNRPATEGERASRRSAPPEIRKWALLIALAASVLLHLLLGVGVSNLIRSQKKRLSPAPDDSLTVRLVAVAPKTPLADKRTTAVKTPEVAPPKAPPTPEKLQATPPPRPPRKVTKPAPPKASRTRRETPKPSPALPDKSAAPGAANPTLNRKPVPLPKGNRNGDPRLAPTPTAEPRLAPLAKSRSAPLPAKAPDREAGKPAASAPVISKEEKPVHAAPTESAPPNLVARDGQGATSGNGGGIGKTDAVAINRGIPFGDVLGITRGGDPKGGGGVGKGAGGSKGESGLNRGLGANTYVRPTPQFTMTRPSRSDEGPPIHIVYVIDVSGSMEEGGKMLRVRDAMVKALGELRSEDFFNIVFFSNKANLFAPAMRPATQSNVGAGILSVGVALPGGATNLSAALDLAFEQSDVTHIFIMSDGEPTEGITDFERIEALARTKNFRNAQILTLALGQGEKFKGMALLRQLAEQGRGTFNYINLRKQ